MTAVPGGGAQLYRFVQFEFPWALGPEDGRYLVRRHAGEEPHHVLVIKSWAAPVARRGGRRRRDAAAPEPPPSATGICRVTLVDAERVEDEAAGAWLKAAGPEALEAGLVQLNEVLRAHRAAVASPYARDVAAHQALVARVGYGAGFEVADGRWSAARELEVDSREEGSRRARRESALRPQERLAALLSGRDAVLACEELVLRARLDLEQGRPREAAMQTHLALEAAVVELRAFTGQGDLATRLSELDGRRDTLASAANEALQGGPSAATVAAVADALERLEATLRARAASARY